MSVVPFRHPSPPDVPAAPRPTVPVSLAYRPVVIEADLLQPVTDEPARGSNPMVAAAAALFGFSVALGFGLGLIVKAVWP